MALLLLLLACQGGPTADSGDGVADGGSTAGDTGQALAPLPDTVDLVVEVTLDGAPVEGATIAQGGNPDRWTTDADGRATVTWDTRVEGDQVVMATHSDARIAMDFADDALETVAAGGSPDPIALALTRFSTVDNIDYAFQDPGEPSRRGTTGQCLHCHQTMGEDWFASPHASSARNPWLHDVYAGVATAFADQESCVAAGGQWWAGLQPGTGDPAERCYLGDGTLPDLNEGCGDSSPCDGVADQTGGCADCHAPGIDGEVGGRDLLDARDHAFAYGVHCDVCHKIEGVDVDDPDPGVAGRLRILRPSEPGTVVGLTEQPLTFGPYDDVPNPRMGSVPRDVFRSSVLCAGCHQLDATVLLPGASIDETRWPEGRLPIQSTYAEWLAGPYGSTDGNSGASCQSCHMPADGDVGNSADLGNIIEDTDPGVAAGWWREPGEVRRHAWFGPRSDEQRMLDLAAVVTLSASSDGDDVVVDATTANVGPGHALPTGEPMRHLLLLVDATCDGAAWPATGGDAVPELGGALDEKGAADDWAVWPGAQVGERIRVVRRTGAYRDYEGFGPFGDGRFSAEDKGLPVEEVAGDAAITAVDGDRVTLDRALPEGDLAYRVAGGGLPGDGDAASGRAGAAGFAFARVLVDDQGRRMVPHHRAVDVVSDNRLLPGQRWTSSHRFAACAGSLQVDAVLVYRAAPLWLATERGWSLADQVIATASVEVAP